MKKNLLPLSRASGKLMKQAIQQPFYLLLSLFLFSTSLQAQCTLDDNGPFPVLSDDTDTETAPFSFQQGNDVLAPGLGAIVDVTSTASIEICFWGDMNAGNETFDVVVGGLTSTTGDYGFTPSQASPVCETFVVTNMAALEADLADGDIDVVYNNFGSGWNNALSSGDQFNAQVISIEFDYDIPVTISNPGNACTDGTDRTFTVSPLDGTAAGDVTSFQIFPSTPGFDVSTGTIDVSEADAGDYNVVYNYDVNGCQFEASQMVSIFAAPRAALANRTISCLPAGGTVELGIMFDGGNDPGGTFTVQSGGGTVMGTTLDPPAGGGCFTIRYMVDNPNGCDNAPYQDEATLLVTEAPDPQLTVSGTSSPACSDGGTVDVTIGRNSTGNNPVYTVDGQVVPLGALSLAAPAAAGSIVYEICLTEAGTMPACPGAPAPTDCSVSDCQSFTVFNDGNECGANAAFASECAPDPDAVSICDVDTNPGLTLTCSFFSGFPTLELVDASLSDVPGIANCDDEEICFEWNGGLNPDLFGGIEYAGPTIADLNPVAGIVCDILKFEICIPLPIVDDICIDPLPFDAAEAACDMTIGEFVLTALEAAVGGGGSSGIIIADTDGDGNFDFVLEEYDFPSMSDQSMPNMDCVPNNIEGESGYITIRNVVAWPFPAQDVCGVISNESINLLELLPIGAIPIVGVIIEDILASASCNVELVFTDEETVRVPVFNSSAPVFANCNTSGYVFSEDGICDTEANWSIPVAYDGCSDDVLAYRGRTAGTDATSYNGTPPAIVTVTESGLYQTAGPIPGSDLAPGTYTVTYTAYSCAAIESTCTFDVVVTSGDPVLACPSDFVVRTDSDVCSAIVTGLSPIQGVSCATIIDYNIDFADGTNSTTTTIFSQANLGTHNDASGATFPLGESTVTYTMRVDINGDGDVDDTIDGTMETQTCDFTVTVQDDERPVAECIDVDVRLDNTGNITVFAEDQADGSTFVNGGSVDNCDTDLDILIAKPGDGFAASVNYDCTETGYNLVTLQVTDDAGNVSTCLSQVHVEDFFEGITFDLDIPEICLENNNPSQLDFSNYLVITLPDGTTLSHDEVEANTYLGDAVGAFGITVFAPAPGTISVDPGTVDTDGAYTMGTGTGFVTVSYVLALPGAVVQNGNVALSGCLEIVHSTFELRQPLDMESPECECIVQNDRVVDLGEISGGLEPYTIQYGGVKLDVDSDGIADDVDGEYTYDTSTGTDIGDFTEDLGNLLVDYTQPTWSFTVIDARGCELFRSGSCDNDDETGTPMIDCTALGAVTLYTRNEENCEVQDTWEHTLPTDNCDVILYTYTIENPDGTIAGPFDISALLNPDITMPLPDQFYGEYDFEHHSPTQNVSTVTYYAEDAVGNFTQCSFTVTVIDDDPPYFINCPEPAVIVDAPPTWCAAFANYSLPLAEDNCGTVIVTQIDDTGLTSGSLFPVGITINTFEAVDETGNSITCDVKIIVNDYHTPPTIACPDDVVDTNDEGDCGAIVDDIAPSGITDNCPENLTVVYRIDDEDGNEVASGFDDASGNFFELGTSTVSYSVQDMPLLLITEVTHELSNTVDGSPATTPSCFDGVTNGDETDVDCGGGVCTSCNCPENEVIVEIVLDNNPGETTWAITEPNDGAILASGGPYAPGMAGMTITESVCLSNDCYDFVIRDAGLDGIDAGGGSYTVTTGDDVLASGGDFGTREVTNFCLDGAPPAGSLAGTAGSRDAVEITNFGSANLDVSCLMIERVYAGGSESYAVPAGAILAPGGVLTIHFGNGHDDLANNVFYVPGTVDLAINEPTAYIVSLSRSVLDVAVMNGFDVSGVLVPPAYDLGGLTVADYWSGTVGPIYGGGIVRTTVWDTDTADDFVPGEACTPVTIGMLNPDLAQPTPNGASTAIQAQPTVRVECSFTVTISDDEPAVCGLYSDYFDYVTGVIDVEYGECVETIIPVGDNFNVADVNLNLSGSAGDLGNLTVTLISPEGTEIELIEAICAGTDDIEFTLDGDFGPPVDISCGDLNNAGELFVPVGDIEAFNGEAMQGNWILQIGHNGQESVDPAALTSILFISARDPYTQGDEVLDNDPGECGADFTWFHPILFDNCPGGSMVMEIFFEGELDATANYPIFPENTEITRFFPVGISTVTYTLTDAAGNTSTCGFTVEVLDVEFPTLTCPPDLVIQLAGGECTTIDYPTIPVTADDNCPGFTFSSIPPGTPVPIGDTIITLIVTDASGNATECTYNLTVLENLPDDPPACIADQNVTLGLDCEAEITADMILSGDDYRCYDNYIVTLYYQNEDGGPGEIIPTSPFAGISEVGQEIVAEVCDPRTGFCCWGYVLIEFKDAPEFICPADATVRCTDSTLPSVLGEPIITSCVPGGAIVEFDDVIQDNGMCGDPRLVIFRTWTVTDGEGNSSSCVQTITMDAFDLNQVVWPPDYDGIEEEVIDCAAALADPLITEPEELGFPTIDGSTEILTLSYCSAALSYTDEEFAICENSYIIFRTWRVINQCDEMPLDNALTHVQTIRVEDADGPDIQCPEDEVVSTAPQDCTANYMVPAPIFIDGCSDVTYQVAVDGDTLTYDPTNIYLLTGLELGEHEIRYIATDECGKYSSCAYTIDVQDLINPTASCDDELNVSIGGGDVQNNLFGEARIYAADVDEGSNDNCSDVTLEVRRNFWRDGTCDDSASRWSDWGDYIDFYCCDINKEITIELRVTDEAENQTVCWMVITPEDKLVPWCYAPENQTVTCAALPLTFPGNIEDAYEADFEGTSAMMTALFGGATGTDNCAVDAVVERDPTININECGWGTITRRWEAWQWRPEGDANGNGVMDADEVWRSTNTCSQLITITEIHDFTIDFPEDADADCEDPDIPTIITETVGCDVLSINIGEPVRFAATGDECYKLSITYDVINWCLWDGEYTGYVLPRMTEDDGEALAVDRAVEGNERPVVTYTTEDGLCIDRRHSDRDGDSSLSNCDSPELPNYGRYVYTQFVKVYDSTAPVVAVGEYGGPTDECPDLEAGQFGDYTGSCDAEVTIPFSVSDECELFDNDGDLVVSIVLAEIDAFAVDANGDGLIKANEFVSDGSVVGNITDNGDGTYVFSGTYPIITSAMGPNVVHAIRVLFEDGCGNQISQYIEFDVIDCKGPAPICINGLTVTLMPTGDGSCAMAIWASDFEGSPIYDCTGQGPETDPTTGNPRVTKYAIYRQTTVEAAGVGFVPDPAQTGITLTQDDDETTIVYIYAFDEEGNYDFCETYVLVQEHITCGGPGMNPSIAGVIATEGGETVENVEVSLNGGMSQTMTTNADGAFMFANLTANFDYSVTPYHNTDLLNGVSTFDLVLMSKHILGVQPLESPYKMIAADVNRSNTITTLDMIQLRKLILNIDTEFSNNTSWRFVETAYSFPQPTNPWSETFPELINFNNLTVGSLDADFVAVKIGDVNGSASANAQSGDDRTLNGIFNLEADDVDMKAGNTYTVSFTANDIVEGFQGTLQLNSVEFVNIEYALATAQNFGLRYADQGMITMSFNEEYGSNDVLFSIVVRATVDAKLSETLSIGSKYTAAEAYRNDNTMDLGVEFAKELPSLNAFALYQNTPNPFQGETLIGFYLPEDGAVTISIADVTGKQLLFLSENYSKGYNTLQVTSEMLQQVTGVLSYTLTSGEFTATKKMIIVN